MLLYHIFWFKKGMWIFDFSEGNSFPLHKSDY
jgi:hypothetical protein